jgi:hypothetical protein
MVTTRVDMRVTVVWALRTMVLRRADVYVWMLVTYESCVLVTAMVDVAVTQVK